MISFFDLIMKSVIFFLLVLTPYPLPPLATLILATLILATLILPTRIIKALDKALVLFLDSCPQFGNLVEEVLTT